MEKLGKEIDKVSNYLLQLRLEIWRKYTLFTWQWWTFVAICIIFLVLFFVMIDKKDYLKAIAYFGIVYILNKNLDDTATALDWYDYRMQLEPIIPTFLPANLFVIPVSLSIVYERCKSWGNFTIITALFAGFVSYGALPLAKVAGIYKTKLWNSHLSFISLFLIATIAKLLIDKAEILYEKGRQY
ncbi:hypothetical protein P8V03_04240 [Clostridium sp. A1-XYC3]|uniref:Uncharacterized protein n=1 Tax=Clostridium tanneri TaxID=3037988 RepID=A0ABU4JQD6_9CLOT|nr:hypothetical protein [Clostridium sp. A1-XYC3]MDW8800359.1 hypothetical protein [Clostridium sp. A1-XYC3]